MFNYVNNSNFAILITFCTIKQYPNINFEGPSIFQKKCFESKFVYPGEEIEIEGEFVSVTPMD